MYKDSKIAFLGGPEISVDFFEKLLELGVDPDLVITTPDKPAGRKLIMSSPPLKDWADQHQLPVLQPGKLLDKDFTEEVSDIDLFIVVAYGKIIPKSVLELPRYGAVNFHPSLLPLYRGASPIISALLDDQRETGVSIMLLDEKMDEGPILAQEKVSITEWLKNRDLEEHFAMLGANMLAVTLPDYLDGTVTPVRQEHIQATYCQKYQKADMEVDLKKPREAFLKYCAFEKPFFFDGDVRLIINDAEWSDDQEFVINSVTPAGKKEVSWEQYQRTRQ